MECLESCEEGIQKLPIAPRECWLLTAAKKKEKKRGEGCGEIRGGGGGN